MATSRSYSILLIGCVHSRLKQLADAPRQGWEGAVDGSAVIDIKPVLEESNDS